MDVTVAVCTAGERSSLEGTLRSLLAQQVEAPTSFELLVVDNSREEVAFVRSVVAEVGRASRLPVRFIRESRAGLGFARNTAIAAARGEIVAFADDDAVADPDWISELVRAYRETGAAAIGGRVDPLWVGDRPTWLGDELLCYLSLLDWGHERSVCRYPNYPFGVNISFRRDVLMELGGFTTFLGVGGISNYSMDETELCRRLERSGKVILYAPEVRMRHLVTASRLTRGYFLQRAAMHGRSSARVESLEGQSSSVGALAKGLALAAPRVGVHLFKAAFFLLSRKDRESLSETRHLVWNLAWMRESIHIAWEINTRPTSRRMDRRERTI